MIEFFLFTRESVRVLACFVDEIVGEKLRNFNGCEGVRWIGGLNPVEMSWWSRLWQNLWSNLKVQHSNLPFETDGLAVEQRSIKRQCVMFYRWDDRVSCLVVVVTEWNPLLGESWAFKDLSNMTFSGIEHSNRMCDHHFFNMIRWRVVKCWVSRVWKRENFDLQSFH